MKTVFWVVALGATLLACGGGSGGGVTFKDPSQVNFTYGAVGATTPGSPEATSAATGASGLSDALSIPGETDASAASTESQNVAGIPNDMASVFGASVTPMFRTLEPGQAALVDRATAHLLRNVAAATGGTVDPNCQVTITGTPTSGRISFDSCSWTETDSSTGAIMTFTIGGYFDRTASAVSWDATFGFTINGTSNGTAVSGSVSDHLVGSLAFDPVAQSINGNAKSDILVSVAAGGQSVTGAVTYYADFQDLVYQTTPVSCFTSGTLTLSRFWTIRPSAQGIDPSEVSDVSVQFTWTGCASGSATVDVSWGTPT